MFIESEKAPTSAGSPDSFANTVISVSRIVELHLQPVLGLPAVSVDCVQLRGADNIFTGLLGDRAWLMIEAQSQAIYFPPSPAHANTGLHCAIRLGELRLTAPGMLALALPLELIEDAPETWRELSLAEGRIACVDEGELAAAWLSNVYDRPLRLWKRRSPTLPALTRACNAALEPASIYRPALATPAGAQPTVPSTTALMAHPAVLHDWLAPQRLTWRLAAKSNGSHDTAAVANLVCTAPPPSASPTHVQPLFPWPTQWRVGDTF